MMTGQRGAHPGIDPDEQHRHAGGDAVPKRWQPGRYNSRAYVRVRWSILFTALLASIAPANAQPSTDILISRQLAEAEHLQAGMTVRLATTPDGKESREFRIAGVYEPTPDPQRLGQVPREVRLHLPDLLALTRSGDVLAGAEPIEGVNVRLKNPARRPRLRENRPGERCQEVIAMPAAESTPEQVRFRVLERFHLAIATVTILAATVRCSCSR